MRATVHELALACQIPVSFSFLKLLRNYCIVFLSVIYRDCGRGSLHHSMQRPAAERFQTMNNTPRYTVIPSILPSVRYLVRDSESGRFCPTTAAGMTRAQAALYCERLNSRAELAEHRKRMEQVS